MPIVESAGMELVDIEYQVGHQPLLRIFIDKSSGVNHSDCREISSRIGDVLDVEDKIDKNYILEVSSPGLDRLLKNEADYLRNKGKLVRISLYAPLEKKKKFIGTVVDVQDEKVTLKEKSEKIICIPIADIAKGKLEIEF